MTLRSYFRKNILDKIAIGDDVKIIGSFSRDYVYPTDIDIYSTINRNYYDDLITKINKKYDKIYFLYVTLFINPYKDIEMEVTDKKDFHNIDFDKIQRTLTKLYAEKLLDCEKYNKLISYTVNKTLENVLKLELEIKSKTKIKWFMQDIKEGSKIVNGIKYNFKDMTNNSDNSTAFILHWLWNIDDEIKDIPVKNTFFFIDVGVIFKDTIETYIKRNVRTADFYKDMYILYYEKDYYYLLKSMIYVVVEHKKYNLLDKLTTILEIDYGIHKQSFNKLYEISKLQSDEFSGMSLENIAEKALNTVKENLKKIKFDYDNSVSILENRQRLINHTNELIKPLYNKFRRMLVEDFPNLDCMMPPSLK